LKGKHQQRSTSAEAAVILHDAGEEEAAAVVADRLIYRLTGDRLTDSGLNNNSSSSTESVIFVSS
jgi:hypothetical protein